MSTSERKQALKEAFGKDAGAFDALLVEVAKVNFDAYKTKVESLATIQDKLSTLAKKVPKFWPTSIAKCPALAQNFDPQDADALAYLTDVKIVHDKKDVRDFTVEMHFSSKNPFFSNTVLRKSLTVTPPAGTETPSEYDLDADLYALPVVEPIKWTSPDHDLTKKAPRPKMEDLEEFDAFDGMGSFFCWFGEDGKDGLGIGETLLEWKSNAIEYAANMIDDDMGSDMEGMPSGDEDDSDDDDPTKEVDLESEDERPKKKTKKA
ncbi:hypothetical protein RQP46_010339 [Phenoliferia psychrophenolica]